MSGGPVELVCTTDFERTYQTVDGFGLNINPVGHWRDGQLVPVLDQLVDDLGCTVFRFDPYGLANWSDPAGDLGRAALSPQALSRAYRSDDFRDAWATARHLRSRGASILLNVSGAIPSWMYASDGRTLKEFDAYAELLTSLVHWARDEEGLDIALFGPLSEPDWGPPEGPALTPAQAVQTLEAIARQMAQAGLGDIPLVAPDPADYLIEYVQELVAAESLHSPIGVVGMHCYHDPIEGELSAVPELLASNGLDWRYWLTEFGDLDQTGSVEWPAAVTVFRRLLRALNGGARAAIYWDAYDNWHRHDTWWTIYGALRVGTGVYTPKKRYFALRNVYGTVAAGAQRVRLTSAPDRELAAFRNPDGSLVVLGMNTSDRDWMMTLQTQIDHDRSHGPFRLNLVAPTADFTAAEPIDPAAEMEVHIPAQSLFSLTNGRVLSPTVHRIPSEPWLVSEQWDCDR